MNKCLKTLLSVITAITITGSSTQVFAASTSISNPVVDSSISNVAATSVVQNAYWGPTTYFDYKSDGTLLSIISFATVFLKVPAKVGKVIGTALFGASLLNNNGTYYGISRNYYEEIYIEGTFAYYKVTTYSYMYSDTGYKNLISSSKTSFSSLSPL